VGPGPVFGYEWLMATRQQHYALRVGFLAVILAGMALTLICGILTWSEVRSCSLACDRVDKLQLGAGIGEPACQAVGTSNALGTKQGY
jgi:hypothetical protein